MDKVSKKTRSRIMRAIKGKHTTPELRLRKLLSAAGLKYRLHYGKHKIDVAFPRLKVAVFVDGCFWHGCPKHFKMPKSNKKYWVPKLERNIKRDKETTKALKRTGWKVLRIWEHELKLFEI